MDGIGNGYSNGVESMASFWKKNAKTVPGRPSPKKDAFLGRTSGSASFNEFQASVNDAWDMGDDEFCIISGNTDTKISKKVSQSAALTVLNSHRGGNPISTLNVLSVHQESKKTNIDTTECSDFKCDLSEQKRSTVERSPSTSERSFYPGRPQAMCCPVLPTQEGDCETKLERFVPLLKSDLLDLTELRHLSWSGIPIKIRAVTWRLLCGYLPVNMERRNAILERKRLDYWSLVKQYYDTERDETYQDTYRQIHIDIPRMNPTIALFQQITVQQMFERILFIWAIRHPASGYVQGINDLVTPFFVVFLQEVVPSDNLDSFDVASLSKDQQDVIEADSFWCLSKFLDSIQDNYIFAQLGIQQKVNQLKELIQRIDGPLHRHLTNHGVDYLQFSFRWMNNLLTRELPLHCTIRLWDTYLAESDGFPSFQLYVCAAFLLRWKSRLMQEKDFQGLLLKLQNLPTQGWTNSDINILVAEAYRLKFMFADAPNHLLGTGANR